MCLIFFPEIFLSLKGFFWYKQKYWLRRDQFKINRCNVSSLLYFMK